MKEYVKGKFIRSIYSSDKGYIIGIMKVLDTNIDDCIPFLDKQLTFTGYFPELKEEENYEFIGEMVDHPKYGIQFQVSESNLILPDTKDGLITFLSSDLFDGIGEKIAKKVVETLGEDCLDKIIKEPSTLSLVPKLTKKKQDVIYQTLKEYSQSHRTIVYLTELGFTMKDAMSIYNFYKSFTENIIKENPYQMINDVDDITFLKVDKLKTELNIDPLDARRIKACIFYIMNDLLFRLGDTYLLIDEIVRELNRYLNIELDIELILNYIDELILEGKIIVEKEKFYTTSIYESEEIITEKISYLANKPKIKQKNLDKYIEQLEKEEGITYNEQQKEAIISALENNVVIITGGPGTGKTTIIKAIVTLYEKIYEKQNKDLMNDLALLAPTGRASKRMMESTNLKASTIHRFLKWDKDANAFMVDEYHKDYSTLIIVDEVSMLDTELMASLLKGLTSSIKLILVGDMNQLPSVGPGNVLKDLIESNIVKTVYLDLLYRQSEDSYIPVLAEEIKNNNLSKSYLEKKDDYLFLPCPKEKLVESMKNIATQLMEKGYTDKKTVILAPMYAGINGIDHLNMCLQDIFNPKDETKEEIKIGDITYRCQDKILQLVNNPDENVFNGDIGFIENIIKENKSLSKKTEIYVNFDGNVVKYLPKDMTKIKHGFVISIHKSQGSEFEVVVMPICSSYARMLYRKLIYTGVTRAKQKLIIIGEPRSFEYAIENTSERLRKTSLKEKLIETYNKMKNV
jgi:exodeoxyribonuclease V alpha subunit